MQWLHEPILLRRNRSLLNLPIHGQTGLTIAMQLARENNLASLRTFPLTRINFAAVDEAGNTIFDHAFNHGHRELIAWVIASSGMVLSPLELACKAGDLTEVNRLLVAGAVANARNNASLLWATLGGHTEIVAALIATGKIDVTARDNAAIVIAARFGYLPIVRALVSAGANSSARNRAALHAAMVNHHSNVIEYLLTIDAAISTTELTAIVNDLALAIDLSIVASHVNADATLLATIAGKAATNIVTLRAIVANRNANATVLTLVVAHANADPALLVQITKLVTADITTLHAIVGNVVHNAITDTAVIDNNLTVAADLTIIAKRTYLASDLHTITIHAHHSADTDLAVAQNVNTLAADLEIIAGRTIGVHAAIAAHANSNAAALAVVVAAGINNDAVVAAHANAASAELIIIASRTGSREVIDAIARHARYTEAAVQEAVAAVRMRLVPQRLLITVTMPTSFAPLYNALKAIPSATTMEPTITLHDLVEEAIRVVASSDKQASQAIIQAIASSSQEIRSAASEALRRTYRF